MKNIFLGFICLLAASMVAKANETLPQGTWEVEQVTSEKNTDGKIQTVVYNSTADIESHIPCPQKLEIHETGVILHYADEWKESASYSFKGDLLILFIPVGNQTYKCEIKDDTITLTATYQYVKNDLSARPVKKTENIREKRIITFKKSNN